MSVTIIDDDTDVSIAASHDSVNGGETVTPTGTRQGNTDSPVTVNVI